MNSLPEGDAIEAVLEEEWLTLWFNRPQNRNALGSELSGALTEILVRVRDRRDVRGITLRGRGGVFCAGGDLKSFNASTLLDDAGAVMRAASREGARLFDLVNEMPQIVIALIEGPAMAGGLGLACCADVVVCDDTAQFAFTETMIGLSPAQISPFVLARTGQATGRRLMLTAARLNAREALQAGLVDFWAPSIEAAEAIENKIRLQALRCAPGAVAATKSLILASPRLSRNEMIDAAADTFTALLLSEEGREGLSAFAEKRRPKWQRP
jgi:isohexenylglutaconyl-CoA hydratase